MRSPLADVRENLREKTGTERAAAFLIPVGSFPLLVWKPPPPRDSWFERVRQIDELLTLQNFLNLEQGRFGR